MATNTCRVFLVKWNDKGSLWCFKSNDSRHNKIKYTYIIYHNFIHKFLNYCIATFDAIYRRREFIRNIGFYMPIVFWGHSKSTFAHNSRVLNGLFALVRFWAPPPCPPPSTHTQTHTHSNTHTHNGPFVLARTHPLPLSFCTGEI